MTSRSKYNYYFMAKNHKKFPNWIDFFKTMSVYCCKFMESVELIG